MTDETNRQINERIRQLAGYGSQDGQGKPPAQPGKPHIPVGHAGAGHDNNLSPAWSMNDFIRAAAFRGGNTEVIVMGKSDKAV